MCTINGSELTETFSARLDQNYGRKRSINPDGPVSGAGFTCRWHVHRPSVRFLLALVHYMHTLNVDTGESFTDFD